ncbi:MAG: hypothetical protein ABJN69_13665 [Hellea sp.]
MRKLSLLFFAALLAGCGNVSGEVSDARSASAKDQRYVLSLYATPTMTHATAKSCFQLAKLGEAEIKKTPGIMGKVFGEHFKPYWKFLVDIGSESSASKKDVLINGKYVKSELEPTFKLTGGLEARSEQCGYVTGQAFVHSGFLNIGDIIDMEDSSDDVTFESDEALGMYLLGQAAEDVYANNQEMIVDCAAAMRTVLPHGEEPDANYFVWLSSLADIVSEGVVDASSLMESSEAFKQLIRGKGNPEAALKELDEDLKASCVSVASAAVAKAQAEVQK